VPALIQQKLQLPQESTRRQITVFLVALYAQQLAALGGIAVC
jgi:hypothetical protein